MHDVRAKKRDRKFFVPRNTKSAFRHRQMFSQSEAVTARIVTRGWSRIVANLSAPLPSTNSPAVLLMDASRGGSAFSEDTASMSLSAYPSPVDTDNAAPASASARTMSCWLSATAATIVGKPKHARSQVVVPPAPTARSATAINLAMASVSMCR